MAHFSISEPGPGTGTAARRAVRQARERWGEEGPQGMKVPGNRENSGACYVGGLQNISKNVRKLQENEINEDGYAI